MHGYKSTGFKTSHEMAQRLHDMATFLAGRPDFALDTGGYLSNYDGKFSVSIGDKAKFVAATKAIGDSEKHYTEGTYPDFVISAKYAPLELKISRDSVCKKTVTYDCSPLFSVEEVEAL